MGRHWSIVLNAIKVGTADEQFDTHEVPVNWGAIAANNTFNNCTRFAQDYTKTWIIRYVVLVDPDGNLVRRSFIHG